MSDGKLRVTKGREGGVVNFGIGGSVVDPPSSHHLRSTSHCDTPFNSITVSLFRLRLRRLNYKQFYHADLQGSEGRVKREALRVCNL